MSFVNEIGQVNMTYERFREIVLEEFPECAELDDEHGEFVQKLWDDGDKYYGPGKADIPEDKLRLQARKTRRLWASRN